MTLNEAIKAMKEWAREKAFTNIYAANCYAYLEAIPRAIDLGSELVGSAAEGLRTQLMYALNNAQGWKGAEARESKKIMRSWIKKNELSL